MRDLQQKRQEEERSHQKDGVESEERSKYVGILCFSIKEESRMQ